MRFENIIKEICFPCGYSLQGRIFIKKGLLTELDFPSCPLHGIYCKVKK